MLDTLGGGDCREKRQDRQEGRHVGAEGGLEWRGQAWPAHEELLGQLREVQQGAKNPDVPGGRGTRKRQWQKRVRGKEGRCRGGGGKGGRAEEGKKELFKSAVLTMFPVSTFWDFFACNLTKGWTWTGSPWP